MNKKRRDRLAQVVLLLDKALSALEHIKDEEQDCLDNLPENLQSGIGAEVMEDNIFKLDEAIDFINSSLDSIEDARR